MRKTTWMLALTALASFGVVGPALAGGDANHGPKGYSDGQTDAAQACNDDGSHSIAYVGPTRLWPPNHRDVQGTVTATGHDTDTVSLTVIGKDNDTNEDSDFAASAATPAQHSTSSDVTFVRERTGQAKAGRTYTIRADATFSDDPTTTCTKYFCVIVPHDMRSENRTVECTPEQF